MWSCFWPDGLSLSYYSGSIARSLSRLPLNIGSCDIYYGASFESELDVAVSGWHLCSMRAEASVPS